MPMPAHFRPVLSLRPQPESIAMTLDQILFLSILGPGRYRFGDFLRSGLPPTALVSAWMARWLCPGGRLWPEIG
jgi:hypothetical protein